MSALKRVIMHVHFLDRDDEKQMTQNLKKVHPSCKIENDP